jgi:hypothetical protein
MIKLIHSSQIDPAVDAGMQILDNDKVFQKCASTIFGSEYSDLKPDKDHVGIHVVAMGDAEHYPMNRNGDLFTKEALVKHHDTFVKHGHVFRHHRNKDPEKSIGIIKASSYNDAMGRVELYIHAHKEKAAPELERLEKEGSIAFSMACKVAYDRCSICNNIRKQAGEKTECSHIRDELGKTYDDGRQVGTYNDEPDFFDISFVGRPADRIAWDLVTHKVDEPLDKETGKIHKTASALARYDYSTAVALGLDSVKYAEYEGVRAPDELAISSAAGLRKLGYIKDLASYHNSYRGWLSKQAAVVSAKDKYLYELRKIASARLDDNTISQLREYDPKVAFSALGEAGVMLDVPSFFKYAMGPDYNVVAPYVSEIERAVPEVIDQAVKQANCQDLCNNTTYDAAPNAYVKQVKPELRKKLAEASMTLDTENTLLFNTISGNTPNFVVDYSGKKCLNNSVVTKLAEKYASYKLSAIDAVIQSNTNNQNNRIGFGGIKQAQASSLSTDEITAIAAAQNLKYS